MREKAPEELDGTTLPALPPATLHLPYEEGPYRMAMGLQSIQEPAWLEIDAEYPVQLAERQRLLAAQPGDVLAGLRGSEAAQQELRALLAQHLAEHYPAWFERRGTTLRNHLTGADLPLEGEAPLLAIGQMVQEDFCLLQQEEEGLRLIAAVLCFPSRWSLAAKMGQLLGPIHKPVPFYADKLQRPVDRFLSLLATGRMATRYNWSFIDDAGLYQPTGHGDARHNPGVTPENAGQTVFLRVERQSFRRLPESNAIAFGIHIHVTPLEIVTAQPAEAARLRAAALAMPPEMERYKSTLPFREAVLAYLEKRAA